MNRKIINRNDKLVLINIIKYVCDAKLADILLSEEFNGKPFLLWNERDIEQIGMSKKYNLKYFFHGVGVAVESKYLTVDYDYSSDGKIGTFNIWKIWEYFTNNNIPIEEDEFEISYQNLIDLKYIIMLNDQFGSKNKLSDINLSKLE